MTLKGLAKFNHLFVPLDAPAVKKDNNQIRML
jgi:hypothetical protein